MTSSRLNQALGAGVPERKRIEGKERTKRGRDQEGKGARESIAKIAGLYRNQKLGEGKQGRGSGWG